MNFIAVDWGSTNLRAWQVANDQCIDHTQMAKGVKNIAPQTYDDVLCEVLAPWRTWIETHQVPVLLAGMVGSNIGWVDSGYLALSLAIREIAQGNIALETSLKTDVWLHPGIAVTDFTKANVMRGEEVQLLGAIEATKADIYLFPGTHSKWIKPILKDGHYMINDFETVMTGELYQLLMQHSLIGQDTAPAPFCPQTFITGVETARNHSKDIIRQLFLARSRRVLGLVSPHQTGSWLSGLLIGHELTDVLATYADTKHIALVGDAPLVEHYHDATQHLGLTATIINVDSTILHGFRRIYATL